VLRNGVLFRACISSAESRRILQCHKLAIASETEVVDSKLTVTVVNGLHCGFSMGWNNQAVYIFLFINRPAFIVE
jgi:hypothetical protein